ncbi:uncharacterized protein LOC118737767 [Rhagoletis pomonella]|uniref:uncharacterized protein LOC118737767 n=1 Tax=Rhagoletis pomonella TaxID=28610 RepID=UPI0017813221|nr:uncharacterized protein LOC118737767 [Rhagoletis pomonella]
MSLSGTASKNQSRRSSRRHRTKDLEQEVELIMSQEDDSDMEMEKSKENDLPTTPKSHKQIDYQHRSPSVGTNDTLAQTPRRSTRKSIKPVQEYEDIVSRKRQLRSASKIEAENIQDADEEPQAKWTPAKVGRVSQKRSRKSRKSTKNQNKSKIISSSEAEDNEYEKDSLKTNTSKESLQIQDSVDTVESEAVAEKNMDILINKITENKAKYTNENIGSELRKEQQEDCINFKEIEAKQGDGVGTYLKNDTFNTSDLGINPLPEEIEENEGQQTNSEQKIFNAMNESFTRTPDALEVNNVEVPVVINNEDSGYKLEDQQKSEDSYNKASGDIEVDDSEIPLVIIKDDTLNNSDCVLVNKDLSEHVDDDMQPLRLSDEESSTSPPRKAPRVILTNEEGKEQILNSSTLFNAGVTPKRNSKTAERKPTPFRPKATVPNNEEEEDCEEGAHSITIEVSKMEPKEIVLRSIRKRSLSVCIGNTEADNRRKNVTFYSPANQTTILEDLDTRIVQSVKKNYGAKTGGNVSFVTQRRKRSMSFDEALINKSKSRSQTPSKIHMTPQKAKAARTKLPNFAAIHQKHFEKMENLVDHVNRKAERAKILINSATKQRVASAQKEAKTQHGVGTPSAVAEKPKAVKRIDLPDSSNSTFTQTSNTSLYKAVETTRKDLNDSKLPIPRVGVCKPMLGMQTAQKENRQVNLPDPRLGIIKPHTTTKASSKNKQLTPAKNAFKPTQTRQAPKPAFNLSTALESHFNYTKLDVATASFAKTHTKAKSAPPAAMSIDEKIAKRRQRHMDMFKARGANARTTPGTAEKNYGQLIRGVRSNRRFELQMAHRKNMEH